MELLNPSFEGTCTGEVGGLYSIEGWFDIGSLLFLGNSPFDLHCAETQYWTVDVAPWEGETYIGLVVRPDNTWERIGQRLVKPMFREHRYELTLHLCRSQTYQSGIRSNPDSLVDFTESVVIGIWGTMDPLQEGEFLGRSNPVTNFDWEEYRFVLEPTKKCRYLIIEAYYKPKTTTAYAGHVLIDAARLVELE